MKTKFFFALLLTMLSVMPMQASNEISTKGRYPTIIGYKAVPVYVYMSNGYMETCFYDIDITFDENGEQVVWDYILTQPQITIFETATGFQGNAVRDYDDNGTLIKPIQVFAKKFFSINDKLRYPVVKVVIDIELPYK